MNDDDVLATILVGGCLPSPNRDRGHWSTRHKLMQDWKWRFYVAGRQAWNHQPCLPRAHLTFTHYRHRLLDPDNAVGAIKPALDGIVAAGIVEDDSSQHVQLVVRQVHQTGKGRQREADCIEVEVRPWQEA